MSTNWIWFVGWVVISLWLGVSWVMVQYGRELWGRIRAVYAHQYLFEQIQYLSNHQEMRDRLTARESSQEDGDGAQ